MTVKSEYRRYRSPDLGDGIKGWYRPLSRDTLRYNILYIVRYIDAQYPVNGNRERRSVRSATLGSPNNRTAEGIREAVRDSDVSGDVPESGRIEPGANRLRQGLLTRRTSRLIEIEFWRD